MNHKVSVTALAASALAALFLACGLGPDRVAAHEAHDADEGHAAHGAKSFSAGEPGVAHEASRTVEIVMSDDNGAMTFSPSRIEVKRGEQVRFVLKNAGVLEHEFLIDTVANNSAHKAEMADHPDMEHEEPNGRHLKPGATAELIWRFTKPGSFEIACLIPGHYESGMKGSVLVD
jgi:uncharacterized cupredoxin-like copper-binding protein